MSIQKFFESDEVRKWAEEVCQRWNNRATEILTPWSNEPCPFGPEFALPPKSMIQALAEASHQDGQLRDEARMALNNWVTRVNNDPATPGFHAWPLTRSELERAVRTFMAVPAAESEGAYRRMFAYFEASSYEPELGRTSRVFPVFSRDDQEMDDIGMFELGGWCGILVRVEPRSVSSRLLAAQNAWTELDLVFEWDHQIGYSMTRSARSFFLNDLCTIVAEVFRILRTVDHFMASKAVSKGKCKDADVAADGTRSIIGLTSLYLRRDRGKSRLAFSWLGRAISLLVRAGKTREPYAAALLCWGAVEAVFGGDSTEDRLCTRCSSLLQCDPTKRPEAIETIRSLRDLRNSMAHGRTTESSGGSDPFGVAGVQTLARCLIAAAFAHCESNWTIDEFRKSVDSCLQTGRPAVGITSRFWIRNARLIGNTPMGW